MSENPKNPNDHKIVAEIARAYGGKVHRYLVKRLMAGTEADDVLQNAYLRLLRLSRADLIRSPEAYLHFVVHQELAQSRLKDSQRPLVYDSDRVEQSDLSDEAVSLDEKLDLHNALAVVQDLLARMPDRQAQVFRMTYQEDLTHPQVAAKLGISERTVKRDLVDALVRVKLALGRLR